MTPPESSVASENLPKLNFPGGTRPTLADWLVPPSNRWAFLHTRELIPTERVHAASPRPLAGRITDGVPASIDDYLRRSCTDALVVLHDGRLVSEWYAPGVHAKDRHILFSVTKSVTGIVAGALIAEGLVSDRATIDFYVPQASVGGYAHATVRDVLDMTANIRFTEDYDGPDIEEYRLALGMLPSSDSQGIHAYVSQLRAAGDHGKSFNYVSPTAEVAGWVCENATGLSLAELITKYVWGPMGAEHDADLLLDRYGASRAGGGLCATARDTARIGQLLVDSHDGPIGQALADIKTPGDPEAWNSGTLSDFLPRSTYRNFWYQPGGQPSVYLAAGIHGQRIYVDVLRRVVIAQLASLPVAYDEPTWLETIPTFAQVARTVSGQ